MGYDYVGDIRTVDTLVKQLRKKLTDECTYIKSVYGAGYLFRERCNMKAKKNTAVSRKERKVRRLMFCAAGAAAMVIIVYVFGAYPFYTEKVRYPR